MAVAQSVARGVGIDESCVPADEDALHHLLVCVCVCALVGGKRGGGGYGWANEPGCGTQGQHAEARDGNVLEDHSAFREREFVGEVCSWHGSE